MLLTKVFRVCLGFAKLWLLMTLIVLVHEAAHIQWAKAHGIRTSRVDVGHGPTFFQITFWGTPYNFKAIPFTCGVAGIHPGIDPDQIPDQVWVNFDCNSHKLRASNWWSRAQQQTLGAAPLYARVGSYAVGPLSNLVLAMVLFYILGPPVVEGEQKEKRWKFALVEPFRVVKWTWLGVREQFRCGFNRDLGIVEAVKAFAKHANSRKELLTLVGVFNSLLFAMNSLPLPPLDGHGMLLELVSPLFSNVDPLLREKWWYTVHYRIGPWVMMSLISLFLLWDIFILQRRPSRYAY